jgi:hypothetical protein
MITACVALYLFGYHKACFLLIALSFDIGLHLAAK